MFLFSVQRWDRVDAHVYYSINVILRDGRQWKIKKRYSEIHEFWRSFPLGSTKHFTHNFPQPQVVTVFRNQDENFNDQRRQDLDEWFGELCMDEKSMSDTRIVSLLDRFLEVENHPSVITNPTQNNSDLPNWVIIPESTLTTFQCKFTSFFSYFKILLVVNFYSKKLNDSNT